MFVKMLPKSLKPIICKKNTELVELFWKMLNVLFKLSIRAYMWAKYRFGLNFSNIGLKVGASAKGL